MGHVMNSTLRQMVSGLGSPCQDVRSAHSHSSIPTSGKQNRGRKHNKSLWIKIRTGRSLSTGHGWNKLDLRELFSLIASQIRVE